MSATVIGTVESAKVAQKAIDELLKAGFKDQDVEILKGDEDEIVAVIVERGFDEDDARGYAKAVSRGKTVVAARAVGATAEKAAAIIERYETGEEEGAELDGEQSVAEVEETLAVGKSKVATGGVRVTTHVSESPVEKTVSLRDEQVEVEHRSADRKLKPEEAEAAFAEQTVEMIGTSEKANVRKEARVTGEVALGKRVEERKETVQRHGSPQRGRGREDQARLSQQALTSLVRDTVGLTIWSVPASLEDRPSAPSAGSFLVSGDTCPGCTALRPAAAASRSATAASQLLQLTTNPARPWRTHLRRGTQRQAPAWCLEGRTSDRRERRRAGRSDGGIRHDAIGMTSDC